MVGNAYTAQWVDLIKRARPGLVLDFGSGNAPDCFDNLIKMEIYAFPNVDVVGMGEKTPFCDAAFRAVFAGAVFEHVVSPSRCAREVHRLLEPGGEIYVETAFLQPFHAYPNHFFNMTTQGAREVFKMFEELSAGVQPHQDPSIALNWILTAWGQKVAFAERDDFLDSTVREILAEYEADNLSRRWMGGFTTRDREELAAGVYFHGRKSRDGRACPPDDEAFTVAAPAGRRGPAARRRLRRRAAQRLAHLAGPGLAPAQLREPAPRGLAARARRGKELLPRVAHAPGARQG
jgi:hypothetical protein